MNKRVLVTGGFGFIGHEVVREFESLGYDVTIIDLLTDYGVIPRQELNNLITDRRSRITTTNWYQIDIANANDVSWVIDRTKPDIVVHLASAPRQQVVAADVTTAVNTMITGTHNVLEASKAVDVEKFVFISSSMVYGDFDYPVHEHALCNPKSTYGILKLTGEQLVKASGLNYAIVRPSAVYGPRDVTGRAISKFFDCALTNKPLKVNGANEQLDFTYVTDLARGIVHAATIDVPSDTFNITYGSARSLLDAAEAVIEIVGHGSIVIGQRDESFPKRGTLSTTRAQEVLSYYPQVNLDQGLELYYEWLNSVHRS